MDVFNFVGTESCVCVPLNEVNDRLNHPAGLGRVRRDHRKPEDGPFPVVVVVNFGNRDIEPLSHMGYQWTDHRPLALQ